MKRMHKIVLIAVGAGCLASLPMILSGGPAPETAPVVAAPPQRSNEDFAKRLRALQMVEAVKSSLRNPDSFTMSSVIYMKDGSICMSYRAQNGFGGMNVANSVETPKGKILPEANGNAWDKYCGGKGEQLLLQ